MPVFSYRAINDDGKEVRGSIESADLEAAKSALTDLHLDVLDVSEATRIRKPVDEAPKAAPTSQTFAFEGQDASGATRRGTIQASSKFNAFQKLKNEQQLTLAMLAPMGTLPKYNDADLVSWQKKEQAQPTPPSDIPRAEQTPKIAFTTPDTLPAKTQEKQPAVETAEPAMTYHPLLQTLTLYAGWLLAWYALFVALGHYANTRALPWDIPFVQAFYVSPFIFTFTVAIFIFLLLNAFNKVIHGRWIGGILLSLLGIATVFFIRTLL